MRNVLEHFFAYNRKMSGRGRHLGQHLRSTVDRDPTGLSILFICGIPFDMPQDFTLFRLCPGLNNTFTIRVGFGMSFFGIPYSESGAWGYGILISTSLLPRVTLFILTLVRRFPVISANIYQKIKIKNKRYSITTPPCKKLCNNSRFFYSQKILSCDTIAALRTS